MGKRLAGKVAVVTGSTSGIGRASAELFAEEGARPRWASLTAWALRTRESVKIPKCFMAFTRQLQ